jgi:hypothetical protein
LSEIFSARRRGQSYLFGAFSRERGHFCGGRRYVTRWHAKSNVTRRLNPIDKIRSGQDADEKGGRNHDQVDNHRHNGSKCIAAHNAGNRTGTFARAGSSDVASALNEGPRIRRPAATLESPTTK